jgi:hypothetical protein
VHTLGFFANIAYLSTASLLQVLLIWHVSGRLIEPDEWVVCHGELVADDELNSCHYILVWHSREREEGYFLVCVCYLHYLANAAYFWN